MSLDIYLYNTKTLTCECGKVHEIDTEKNVFDANITHNLHSMADEAGIGDHLWNPYDVNVNKAIDLIDPLNKAIVDMEHRPDYYQKFDASNGWGKYVDFLPWLKNLLDACEQYPDATIEISK